MSGTFILLLIVFAAGVAAGHHRGRRRALRDLGESEYQGRIERVEQIRREHWRF